MRTAEGGVPRGEEERLCSLPVQEQRRNKERKKKNRDRDEKRESGDSSSQERTPLSCRVATNTRRNCSRGEGCLGIRTVKGAVVTPSWTQMKPITVFLIKWMQHVVSERLGTLKQNRVLPSSRRKKQTNSTVKIISRWKQEISTSLIRSHYQQTDLRLNWSHTMAGQHRDVNFQRRVRMNK